MRRLIWIALAALLTGCGHGPPEPVEIEASDVCSLCKMAISEKRYAAELLDADGAVHKFDDLHCFLKFRRERKPRVAAAYVMDYEQQRWIEASRAHFVRSEDFHTPMSGGIIALADATAAERHARAHGATVLRFDELPEN